MWFEWIKSVDLSRNLTPLNFASLSIKAGELKGFLRKDEILESPRRQITSKMFSVVATTWNSSLTHRSRRTTREKWTVTWFWPCAVACLTIVVVRSRRILNSLLFLMMLFLFLLLIYSFKIDNSVTEVRFLWMALGCNQMK